LPSSTLELLKSLSPTISVGMLTADLLSLGSELELLESTGVKVVHVDVMDGCFTPMMTVGPPLVRAMKTPLLKDVHLMIDEPLHKVGDYVAAGADIVTVHVESCTHVHRVLQLLGTMTNANDPARGLVRGLALNPGTPLSALEPLLDEVDLVLLLAVNPGFPGQRYLAQASERIARARELIARRERDVLLGIDGGITRDNIGTFARAGVDLVITGSAVFDGKAPAENARFMIQALSARAER
jgi:ribulose-phosphate 3-epimerase